LIDEVRYVYSRREIHPISPLGDLIMPVRPIATIDADPLACCTPLLAGPMAAADAAVLAKAFAALGDPVRVQLLGLLANGEVCACDLVEPVGKSQPTVSHHLKVLSEAGLVHGEKRGRWVWYSVDAERVAALRHALADQK
jgi:ArsR family transcriptional regulator